MYYETRLATNMFEIGQLVSYLPSFEGDKPKTGVVIEIKPLDDELVMHLVKILWQDTGVVEYMQDWYAIRHLKVISQNH